jgi:Fe-S-cluster containining protein
MDAAPWYRHGLRFQCLRCGLCCTGTEGYVWLTADDIARIAAFRGETTEAFQRDHVRWVEGKLSLLEKPGGNCEMFDPAGGCTIYDVRPAQCRTWPFWPVNVATASAWKDTGARCPGVGAGEKIPAGEIEERVRQSTVAGV